MEGVESGACIEAQEAGLRQGAAMAEVVEEEGVEVEVCECKIIQLNVVLSDQFF